MPARPSWLSFPVVSVHVNYDWPFLKYPVCSFAEREWHRMRPIWATDDHSSQAIPCSNITHRNRYCVSSLSLTRPSKRF